MTSASKSLVDACSLALVLAACASAPTDESGGAYVDDAAITAKVKSVLSADQEVRAANIHVDTYKGGVLLFGFVDNTAEIARAVELAQRVPGVKQVRIDVALKPIRP